MNLDFAPTMVRALNLLDALTSSLTQSHQTIAALAGENARLRRDVADLHAKIAVLGGIW